MVLQDGALRPYTVADGLLERRRARVRRRSGGRALDRHGQGPEPPRHGRRLHEHRPLEDGVQGAATAIGTATSGSAPTRAGLLRLRDGAGAPLLQGAGPLQPQRAGLFEDREGSLWVGTGRRRAQPVPRRGFTTIGEPEGLSADVVIAVHADAGRQRLGRHRGGGLNRIRNGQITSVHHEGRPLQDSIASVDSDAAGPSGPARIGVGLNRLRDGRITVYRAADGLAHDSVFALLGGRDGSLWVGTRGGGLNHLVGVGVRRATERTRACAARSSGTWPRTPRARSGSAARRACIALARRADPQGRSPDIPAHTPARRLGRRRLGGTARRGLYRWKDGRVSAFTTREGLLNDT